MSSTSAFTFYWVDTGNSRGVTYTYTSVNGLGDSATATFNVTGPNPQSVSVTPATDIVRVVPAWILPDTGQYLQFGNAPNGSPGVTLTVSPSQSQGSYVWVQLVESDTIGYVDNTGRSACRDSEIAGDPDSGISPDPSPLDGVRYPTQTGGGFQDSPYVPLAFPDSRPMGEGARPSFQVVTYLMWDPQILPAGQQTCVTGAGCASIPIPLGTLAWGYSSDAIDRTPPGNDQVDWIVHCGTGVTLPSPTITFQATPPSSDPVNYAYPRWTNRDPLKFFVCP